MVELALSLPRNSKVDAFRTKKILKDAFHGVLPEALYKEPKRGWFSPGAKWLRIPEVTKVAREILSGDYYENTAELFDWKAIEKMLDDHLSKKEYNLTLLWAIMSFQMWAKNFRITL